MDKRFPLLLEPGMFQMVSIQNMPILYLHALQQNWTVSVYMNFELQNLSENITKKNKEKEEDTIEQQDKGMISIKTN